MTGRRGELATVDEAALMRERWLRMEREADEDIAAGRVRIFDSIEDLLADIEADAA